VLSRLGSQQMGNVMARSNQSDLVVMAELLETGNVVPIIDRGYPLSQTAAAIRYLIDEHARGKVVITMGNTGSPQAG
jgi:NADPH:quinone reductase-like Zn-dependent oxidoreductase